MPHSLVIFDSQGHDLVSDGSEYFLNKGIIEADTAKEAVTKLINNMVLDCYGENPDEEEQDNIKDMIRDLKQEGFSVVKLAAPKVVHVGN
jgi:hypothetical protein